MPKEPFIPQNAEELHAVICERRGIPLDSQKAIDMLRDLKVGWDRALATDPLQRPQPAEHPTITTRVSPGVQASARPNSSLQHGASLPAAENPRGHQAIPKSHQAVPGEDSMSEAKPRLPIGRRDKVQPFYDQVAHAMRDGTTLREALRRCDVVLTERELQALSRRKSFQRLYQEERRKYDLERFAPRGTSGDVTRVSDEWLAGQRGSNAQRAAQRGGRTKHSAA